MLRSMTGFGRAEGLVNEKKVTVELRSVNSKQLDLQVKMPSVWREKETELRQWAGERVVRGKADLYVGIDGTKTAKRTTFNADLIKVYHDELRAVAREIAPDNTTDLLAVVLRMPDVMSAAKDELDPAEWTATQTLIEQAWQAYESFRKAEGEKLYTELKDRTAKIMRLLADVEAMDAGRIDRTRVRILSRLEELKAKVDQDRFEQELVFYLDKMDVTEEKVRLA
ncbi:MAG: YicC/YloC family endoribonuclease, partial [Flavobacteriales bacterium]